MAGRAEIPENAKGVIKRCYLLNDQKQWEPAVSPLNRYSTIAKENDLKKMGPGVAFARSMAKQNQAGSIGLVVNAGSELKIDDWLGKSKAYRGIRGRSKAARLNGKIKGVIWLHGEEAPEDHLA